MQSGDRFVKLIVTGRWPHVARQIISELRKAVPGAHIRSAGFRSFSSWKRKEMFWNWSNESIGTALKTLGMRHLPCLKLKASSRR